MNVCLKEMYANTTEVLQVFVDFSTTNVIPKLYRTRLGLQLVVMLGVARECGGENG